MLSKFFGGKFKYINQNYSELLAGNLNAKCKMQNAMCKMQNAYANASANANANATKCKCKMQ